VNGSPIPQETSKGAPAFGRRSRVYDSFPSLHAPLVDFTDDLSRRPLPIAVKVLRVLCAQLPVLIEVWLIAK
jgi:hypothetical protein